MGSIVEVLGLLHDESDVEIMSAAFTLDIRTIVGI